MENNIIKIPEFFKSGIKFKSKWINNGDNTCTLNGFNNEMNIAVVRIQIPNNEWVEDDWNLQHTIWGFENSDYVLIEK